MAIKDGRGEEVMTQRETAENERRDPNSLKTAKQMRQSKKTAVMRDRIR